MGTDSDRVSSELQELGHSASKCEHESQRGDDCNSTRTDGAELGDDATSLVCNQRQGAFQYWAKRVRWVRDAMHPVRDGVGERWRRLLAQHALKNCGVGVAINRLCAVPRLLAGASDSVMSHIERKVIEFAKTPELPEVSKLDRDLVQRVCLTMLSVHGEDEFVANEESGWRVNDVGDAYTVVVMLNANIRIDYFDMNTILNVDLSRVSHTKKNWPAQ